MAQAMHKEVRARARLWTATGWRKWRRSTRSPRATAARSRCASASTRAHSGGSPRRASAPLRHLVRELCVDCLRAGVHAQGNDCIVATPWRARAAGAILVSEATAQLSESITSWSTGRKSRSKGGEAAPRAPAAVQSSVRCCAGSKPREVCSHITPPWSNSRGAGECVVAAGSALLALRARPARTRTRPLAAAVTADCLVVVCLS